MVWTSSKGPKKSYKYDFANSLFSSIALSLDYQNQSKWFKWGHVRYNLPLFVVCLQEDTRQTADTRYITRFAVCYIKKLTANSKHTAKCPFCRVPPQSRTAKASRARRVRAPLGRGLRPCAWSTAKRLRPAMAQFKSSLCAA